MERLLARGAVGKPLECGARLNQEESLTILSLRQSTLAGLAIAGSLPEVSWAVRGDQLHIRNYNDVSFLDPPFGLSGADSMIIRAIFQSLLKFKTDGTWDTELDAAEY
jgi:ABC-type oligopeptide transport system substrate-binding subunit